MVVEFEEITNLITEKMMDLEILTAAQKLRISRDESKLLDPNLIMDARHKMCRVVGQDNHHHQAKCLLLTESNKRLVKRAPASGTCLKKEQELLDKELKRFEWELYRARPKFRSGYGCSRSSKGLASSDDDDFWKISGRSKDKVSGQMELRQGDAYCFIPYHDFIWKNLLTQAPTSNSPSPSVSGSQPAGGKSDNREKGTDKRGKINKRTPLGDFALKSESKGILAITRGEMPYFGSIKITVRGKKQDANSNGQDSHTLKKYLNALRDNALKERRLREIKIKIQKSIATALKKKYFESWKTASKSRQSTGVTHEKKAMREVTAEETKIEMFINAIAEKQKELVRGGKVKANEPPADLFARSSSTSTSKSKNNDRSRIRFKHTKVNESSVQTRVNTQKRIIEQQRAKLVEQNRIIEEFRQKQAQEDIITSGKRTMCAAKEALTLCGRKTRRILIQIMCQAGYRSKPLLEPLRVPSPPKFLLRMEARAEARKERRRVAESARRKKLEEQRNREIAVKMGEEEKLKRLQREAERETRRIRREKEDRRLRETERWKKSNVIADVFYRKYLLRKYIMEPFTMLIEMRDNHNKIADSHFQGRLLGKAFRAWKLEVDDRNDVKIDRAILFYNKKLQSKAIEAWKLIVNDASAKCQVAKDFYDMKLVEGHFKVWCARYADVKQQFDDKAALADKHYEIKMISKYFNIVKNYREIRADFENRVRRKNELRQIVQTVLPDFNPIQEVC